MFSPALNALPDEMIVQILELLDLNSLIYCSPVSRDLNAVSMDVFKQAIK